MQRTRTCVASCEAGGVEDRLRRRESSLAFGSLVQVAEFSIVLSLVHSVASKHGSGQQWHGEVPASRGVTSPADSDFS